MKVTSIFSYLFLSLLLVTISSSIFAQRNVNPYKGRERILIIDESNVYDATKDTKRQDLVLKDEDKSSNNFSSFVNNIKTIDGNFLVSETANVDVYSFVSIDTYNTYFNITNGIDETIVLAPKDNNRLYLVGKLDNMPSGITALLFYAFEGNSIQFSKLVTFNEEGEPIAVQEVQYYIQGSEEGMEGKMTCQINEDQTLSCINYKEGEDAMIPTYEQIYEVQEDGSIEEIGLIDLETQVAHNGE